MKTKFFTLLAVAGLVCSALSSCSNDNKDDSGDSGGNGGGVAGLRVDQTEITGSLTQATTFKIVANADATWELKYTSHKLTVTPTSGTGPATISVTCSDPGYREVGGQVRIYLTGTVGTENVATQVLVNLPDPDNNAPSAPTKAIYPEDGATDVPLGLRFAWNAAVDPDDDKITYILEYSTDQQNWTKITRDTRNSTEGIKSAGYAEANKCFTPGTKYYWRVTSWDMFGAQSEPSKIFSFTTTESTDSWKDGEARLYQNNANGSEKAFTLIVTGDGFTAADMVPGGNWDILSTRAIEGIFNYVEPYKTYRQYLRVWRVAAISNESGCSRKTGGTTTPCHTLRDTKFGTMLDDGGSSAWCGLYSKYEKGFPFEKQPGKSLEDMVDFLYKSLPAGTIDLSEKSADDPQQFAILCIINEPHYGGLVNYDSDCKYTMGFVCASPTPAGSMKGFENVVVHEIGGHAIGHLADCYTRNSTITQAKVKATLEWQKLGWYQNVSVVNDKTKCPWNFFFNAPEYDMYYSCVGMFEGARSHIKGIWRSEQISCMNDNRFYYDAPSRYSIVKQLKAAAGEEMVWSEFVNRDYDRLNANTGTRSTFIPYNTGIDLPEPVLVPKKR